MTTRINNSTIKLVNLMYDSFTHSFFYGIWTSATSAQLTLYMIIGNTESLEYIGMIIGQAKTIHATFGNHGSCLMEILLGY